MSYEKKIEVWYSEGGNRECQDAKSMKEALSISRKLDSMGKGGIVVDVAYYHEGEIIESKSQWFQFKDNILKQI